MANYRYIHENGGKGFKYLPKDLTIDIMQYGGNEFVLTGDVPYITDRVFKTLRGAQRHIERNYPSYRFSGEW